MLNYNLLQNLLLLGFALTFVLIAFRSFVISIKITNYKDILIIVIVLLGALKILLV